MLDNSMISTDYPAPPNMTTPSLRTRKWSCSVVLNSDRDIELIWYLNLFGRVDSEFLRKVLFEFGDSDAGRVKVRRSVKRLEEKGILVSSNWINGKKVYALSYSSELKKLFTDLGVRLLGKRTLTHNQIDHDLYVCRIFEMWREKFKDKLPYFLTERALKKKGMGFDHSMPDLIFSSSEDFKTLFIVEIETSEKSKLRYQKKIMNFLELNGLRAITFYCLTEPIKKRITSVIKELKAENLVKVRGLNEQ